MAEIMMTAKTPGPRRVAGGALLGVTVTEGASAGLAGDTGGTDSAGNADGVGSAVGSDMRVLSRFLAQTYLGRSG
jgi:hypothetical protein